MRAALLIGVLTACLVQPLAARQVLLIGQDGQISWTGRVEGVEGISTIQSEHRSFLDPNVTEIGNAPADLIEFKSADFPTSILPRRVGAEQNLVTEVLERGGSLRAPTVFDLTALQMQVIFEDMLAADPTGQAFERKEDDILGTQLILDLGARFGVNRVRFFPRNTVFPSPGTPFQNDFLKNFEVEINDGLVLTSSGNPIWETYTVRNDNSDRITEVLIDPPRYIRFIRLRATSAIPFEIEKLQVFGEGFFPTARYISPIIDMGSPANWGLIRTLQQQVGDADLADMQLRTRSGHDPSPLAYTRKQVAPARRPRDFTVRGQSGRAVAAQRVLKAARARASGRRLGARLSARRFGKLEPVDFAVCAGRAGRGHADSLARPQPLFPIPRGIPEPALGGEPHSPADRARVFRAATS